MTGTNSSKPAQRTRSAARDGKAAGIRASATQAKGTRRFEQKRERVIDAATRIMNERGVHGMTFVEVADAVGLSTSSITYYFRFKEQLAAAVFADTLSRIARLVETAAQEATPQARVRAYLSSYLNLQYDTHRGQGRPIAVLSDLRALEDSVRLPLAQEYSAIFRRIRNFFSDPRNEEHRALNTARAQVLTETVYWLPAWLFQYSYADFARVSSRLFDLFERGLALTHSSWQPQIIPLDREDGMAKGQENFLRVATRVIGERGYRGASVERIANELNVTKGSFYHHLEAKDDLVLACFRSSYATVAKILRAEIAGSRWQHLTSIIATLVDTQLAGDWPLMRTSALQTLPPDLQADVLARSRRVALGIAGIISDGISEGTIRAVDPLIAAQVIMPALNAAYEQHNRAARLGNRERAVELYASTLIHGLFDDRLV
jgi:AcrR family transcriptional regulator